MSGLQPFFIDKYNVEKTMFSRCCHVRFYLSIMICLCAILQFSHKGGLKWDRNAVYASMING